MNAKMEKAIQNLDDSIRGIRVGAVTPSFIDTFKLSYYGQSTPIKHLAMTSSEQGLVMIKPHDVGILGAIQKTLKDAGFNAYLFSKQAVAVSVPPMSGEERERIKTHVKKLGEDTKIAVRNIRKTNRKADKTLPEDEQRKLEKQIQDITDKYILIVDEMVDNKLEMLSK